MSRIEQLANTQFPNIHQAGRTIPEAKDQLSQAQIRFQNHKKYSRSREIINPEELHTIVAAQILRSENMYKLQFLIEWADQIGNEQSRLHTEGDTLSISEKRALELIKMFEQNK